MTKQTTPTYFQADNTSPQASQPTTRPTVAWTAPDSAQRTFSTAWYLKITLFFVAITVMSVLWLKSPITAVLFVVVYIALIIYTKKGPQLINYSLSEDGLFINDQAFKLEDFSSFGVIEDRELFSVVLLPHKRLATSLVLNFDKKDGEAIVDFLGAVMPMKPIQENLIDKLIRRLGL